MKLLQRVLALTLAISLLNAPNLFAYWVWSPVEGKFVQPEGTVQRTAEEQYDYALQLKDEGVGPQPVIKILKDLVEEYPHSPYAPEAQYMVAMIYEDKSEYGKAAGEFQKLISDFPRSPRIDEGMEHLFRIGNYFLEGKKEKVLGLALIPVLPKAAEIFESIVKLAPYGPFGDQAQLRLGIAYQKMGKLNDAITAFERLLESYPDSILVDEAHYQLAETSYQRSQVANRDQRARQTAGEHLTSFIETHESSSLSERARLLKQELDEQDSEKNYRIGLYYEDQGFIDSAMIYYEDVARRYPDAPYGQKAAQKLSELSEPLRALQKTEEERQKRVAEVDAMLETLDQRTAIDAAPGALAQTLLTEKQALLSSHERIEDRTREELEARAQKIREREKNLREKFKTFSKRKKTLGAEIPSLELDRAFKNWEISLFKEQRELMEQRALLEEMRITVPGEPSRWDWSWNWIPFVGGDTPTAEELLAYKDKDWQKLLAAREPIAVQRLNNQNELRAISETISAIREAEFEAARKAPGFEASIPSAIRGDRQVIKQLDRRLQVQRAEFDRQAAVYEGRFGSEFTDSLRQIQSTSNLSQVDLGEVSDSGVSALEAEIQKLQIEKAELSETWIIQRDQVDTLKRTAGLSGKSLVRPSTVNTKNTFALLSDDEQSAFVRGLKKRMKFIEREIRWRLDQIEDWERNNTERVDQLEYHLNRGKVSSSNFVQKLASPVTGMFKLGKIFIFGMENRDQVLNERAKDVLINNSGSYTTEERREIRKLQEEIELQSILIQSRASEVVELETELGKLRKKSDEIPNFKYQSALVPRFPGRIEYSLESAANLVGDGDEGTLLSSRLMVEEAEADRIERKIKAIQLRIGLLAAKLKATQSALVVQKQTVVVQTPAAVNVDIPGDTESLPAGTVTDPDAERKALEKELNGIHAGIEEGTKKRIALYTAHKKSLYAWYSETGRNRKVSALTPEERKIRAEGEVLFKKQAGLQKGLAELAEKEYKIVVKQKSFLDDKLSELNKRFQKLKGAGLSQRGVLTLEIEQISEMRGILIRDITFLQSVIQA